MIDRKKKLRLIQSFLLIFALLAIYLTYYQKETDETKEIISSSSKEKLKELSSQDNSEKKDMFFDIEYSGIDLNGNRYLLKSEEANLDGIKPEIVYMKIVNAIFYFKDDTTLYVWADSAVYNNKTLDIKFEDNVRANYLESKLFADKADYSNTDNYLSIYENVKINDKRGNLIADKLLFDITKQKLDITSFNDGRINANINLNEKRF
ncbi:MAG: hypothetical protein CBC88_02170 [Candidatus Pelagibacter sp. TMED128]|nr:MAG: hypothetical protein CBC88_02170 [Candidatus Pelagibacter sp. TMED128]